MFKVTKFNRNEETQKRQERRESYHMIYRPKHFKYNLSIKNRHLFSKFSTLIVFFNGKILILT